MYPITFQNYLENYGKYTPGVPDDVDLSKGKDEMVTVRFIAVICPEDENGSCELVPTAYNYQTTDNKDPKNFIGSSFHLGVGSRTDTEQSENVYLVKTKSNGSHVNTWFRLTNEDKETEEQKEAVGGVLGTRSTGIGRNRVQCFQIPRKQKIKQRNILSVYSLANSGKQVQYRGGGKLKSRGIKKANVSYGSDAGRYQNEKLIDYKRDKDQNVTITFAYYYSVSQDREITDKEVNDIMDTLIKVIKKPKQNGVVH